MLTCVLQNELALLGVVDDTIMRREIFTTMAVLPLVASSIWCQANDTIPLVQQTVTVDGEVLYYRVEDGDTLLLADLADVSVTSFRTFESDADYRRYLK
jgi:hypothetical protein